MAMFRKPYTTTSSVSFAFPPPTAVAGILGAILGFSNNAAEKAWRADYWEQMKGTSVSMRINSKTKWLRGAVNFWNTKNPTNAPHIQVEHQYLASPSFRIFVRGPLEESLTESLIKGSFVYTPYLGVAYAIADIQYVGSLPCEKAEPMGAQVTTILPFEKDLNVDIDIALSKGVFRETVPFELSAERTFVRSLTVLYSTDARHYIALKKGDGIDVTRCGDDVVAWLPEW